MVHDVVSGGHLDDFLDLAAPETVHVVVLDDPGVSATPRWGLWLDATAAPPGDLADAVLSPEQVRGCQDRLTDFLERYLPHFYRAEQRANATLVIRGLLSGLQRKTCEPIAAQAGVTAAEVRSSPDRYVGQLLEWRLQVISVETADELRSEMAPGQPYLLTRGPLPEPGFVYVIVPADQVSRFRSLPPLHEATLRVMVRAARSKYLTTPVVELVSVVEEGA